MKKYVIHPLFLLYCLFVCFSGKLLVLLCNLLALYVHELSHYLVAKRHGFIPNGFSITPFGATLSYENASCPYEFIIAFSGPLINLISCTIIVALWWLFPSIYPYTLYLCQANLFLALFNLLPVFPFDGGRMILALSKNKLFMLKILRIIGAIIGFILLVAGIVSIFFTFSISLFFGGIVILYSILFDVKNQKYRLIINSLFVIRDMVHPLEKIELYVYSHSKVRFLISAMKKEALYTVNLVDSSYKTIRTLSGAQIEKLFFANKDAYLDEIYLQ